MRPAIFLEQNAMAIRLTDDDGLTGVKNKVTGALIHAATVQVTLLDLNNVPAIGLAWPVILNEQGTTAVYAGVVPVPSPVDQWKALEQYRLKIVFQGAGGGEYATWKVPVTIVTRTD